jgi:hypothetical protein
VKLPAQRAGPGVWTFGCPTLEGVKREAWKLIKIIYTATTNAYKKCPNSRHRLRGGVFWQFYKALFFTEEKSPSLCTVKELKGFA